MVTFKALGSACALYGSAAKLFPAAASRPASARSAYGLTVRAVKEIPPTVKMAAQARIVYATIAAAGKAGITESALANALVPAGLVTRQSPLRIYRFYRKMLVDGGYIVTA